MQSVSQSDENSINEMSFVPTQEQLVLLYKQSIIAKANICDQIRGPLLSKLYYLPGKFGLCPDSLNPNDTVLVKMAKQESNTMTFIPDRNMTFGGGSNGPNGVLVDCQNAYGPNRINLFDTDESTTKILLTDYISYRTAHLREIYKMFVQHLKKDAFLKEFKIDPTKDATLPVDIHDDYRNIASMFSKVLDSKKSIEDSGIKCVSFCQTWLRNGHNVGDAQFSVMSPHFQTRFFVSDDDKLKNCGVSDIELSSYVRMITHHNSMMGKDYGVSGGGQAFINLDGLLLTYGS
jgi:hypothetical protein